MFICSVRSSTLKFAAALTCGVALVAALVVFLPSETPDAQASGEAVVYNGIETTDDMARFLAQYGLEAEKTPLLDRTVTLPEKFDGVFAGYNELQKQQGFDLSQFSGAKLRKAVLRVKSADGKSYLATLFVYRNTVVGGDVSDEDPNGGTWTFGSFAAGGKT